MSSSRPKPNPPSLFPVLFIFCAALLTGAYFLLEQLGFPPGYALLFAPLLLPLLPAEIRYSLARRKICSDIITDFVSRGPEVDTDYDRILARMNRPGLATQTLTTTGSTGSDDSQGPISWR